MPCLTADQVLAADDIQLEMVPTPEWGDGAYVCVRSLSADERDSWEIANRKLRDDGKLDQIRARFAQLVCVDDDKKRLFTAGQVEQLGRKSAAPLDRIFDAGMALSGMMDRATADAKKNS